MATLIPKYQYSGSTTVNRPINVKLEEMISVEDFDGATDQLKVQAAFDSGKPIKFTRNYSVDTVTIASNGQIIDFNGYSLIGTRPNSSTTAQYVLGINARELTLFNVSVNADFKNYRACIRWFSLSAGQPAQYNNVYGMAMAYCGIGLLFGQEIGTPSVDAPQSESTVYGLKCRGIQQCFVGNQSNGFITLVSPQLDCNPYEWLLQPGFNAPVWQTAARSIINRVGHVTILGGEILKTSTQLGYGVEGSNLVILGTVIEIACANFYVYAGYIELKDCKNFYMASDASNVFTLDASAGDGYGTMIDVDSCEMSRGNGVAAYSGSSFINQNSTIPIVFKFTNCTFRNWSAVRIACNDPAIVGAGQVSNAIVNFVNSKILNFNTNGTLNSNFALQDTSSATTTAVASAATIDITSAGQIFHISGTAAINTISPPLTSWKGTVTAIPDGAFTLATGGNIGKASTAVVGQAMTLHYDGNVWYPSY